MTREQQLLNFVAWWKEYCKGDEKGEAQIFLDRLFRAFGHAGVVEAGGILEDRIRRQGESRSTVAFADLVVPKLVLFEMKKRGEDLRKHYHQALDYWINLVPHRPRYVVLCNFDEFWVYDLNIQIGDPLAKVRVAELPQTWGPLAFLWAGRPEEPIWEVNPIEVTEAATYSLSQLFHSLQETPLRGRSVTRAQAQRFVLQCMVALFAEDTGLLERYFFTQLIEDCLNRQAGQASAYDLISGLFETMNRPGKELFGRFRSVDYFDGGLFAEVHRLELTTDELRLLHDATAHNWAKIRPAIFGSMFEYSMDQRERHQFGGHYTSEVDIYRIVQPVIVRPWRERIEAANTLADLRALQEALRDYQVLDPACGSGNFLYVAYREMKRLEKLLLDRIQEHTGGPPEMGFVTARQFWGLDVNSFAVELAKVTLNLGKKLAVDELHLPESPLPLDNLDANIRCADALFEPWPEFDACIGNPPYLGAKRLKVERGVEYVNRVRAAYPDVPGMADYCVYWFRKAHEQMKPGARAGLVGTNTVRQNYSRIGGLDYVVEHDGHIFEAVSSIPWSGEAKVHVSIACWSKGEPPFRPARLWVNDGADVVELSAINSALSTEIDVSGAVVLACNVEPKRVFQGLTPGHEAFVLEPDEAREIIRRDPSSQQVIFPYMTGSDLVGKPSAKPSRFIIDMNNYDAIEAQQFRAAYVRIKTLVLPVREAKAQAEAEQNRQALAVNPNTPINISHQQFLENWWRHSFTRTHFTAAAQKMPRYVICSRISKRPIFDYVSPQIRISDKIQAFLFEDDYSYGILQSNLHWQWWLAKGATLTARPAYTPHSVFDTFPWPQFPTPEQVKAVARAGRALHEYRREAMRRNPTLTLREMYRSLELPGANPLKDLHAALDRAVLAAYGFDAGKDLLAQLLALNAQVAARIAAGQPVTGPGVPPDYPDPAELVSTGCIAPPPLEI